MTNSKQRQRGRKVPQNVADVSIEGMPPLPDTSKWLPREDKAETLQGAFLKRCIGLEKAMQMRVQLERDSNLDNFDSGSGIEDVIREELGNRKILTIQRCATMGGTTDGGGTSWS